MPQFPPALPHGDLEEVFPDVFFVSGAMHTELMGSHWEFSRNMTVVRDGAELTLINSVRLDDGGLQKLESLGRIAHVVRLGALHGRDDGFYRSRYGASLWALPGHPQSDGTGTDQAITEAGPLPFGSARAFVFRTTQLPEAILHLDRAGGILIACDALQNWESPDEHFSDQSRATMAEMGFFQPANFGPLWMQLNQPKAEDFQRLLQLPFRHALCGHGTPLRDRAKEAYGERCRQVFGD